MFCLDKQSHCNAFLKKRNREKVIYRHRDNTGPGLLKNNDNLSSRGNNHPACKSPGFFVPFDTKQTLAML